MQTTTKNQSVAQRPVTPAPESRDVDVSRPRKSLRALAAESGQGTVEYVGLLLLMASVLAGVVTAANKLGGKDQIGTKVVQQVGKSIDTAADAKADK